MHIYVYTYWYIHIGIYICIYMYIHIGIYILYVYTNISGAFILFIAVRPLTTATFPSSSPFYKFVSLAAHVWSRK